VSGVYFTRVTVYHTFIEIEVLYPWSRFGFFMVGMDVLGDLFRSVDVLFRGPITCLTIVSFEFTCVISHVALLLPVKSRAT